jgi:putative transposase
MGAGGDAHPSSEIRRPFTHNGRALYSMLRTGCQWRQLPSDFPAGPTVLGCYRDWRMTGVWMLLHRALYPLARLAAGRNPEPTLIIMDGQSAKTTERGGVRRFDGHK